MWEKSQCKTTNDADEQYNKHDTSTGSEINFCLNHIKIISQKKQKHLYTKSKDSQAKDNCCGKSCCHQNRFYFIDDTNLGHNDYICKQSIYSL